MTLKVIALTALLVLCITPVSAQEKIGWIPSLKQGFNLAKQTNKPIFLLSAAPQCIGVPGTW